MSRKNPYQMLLEEFRDWVVRVVHARRRQALWYTMATVNQNADFSRIWERTIAAQQIGYEVVVKASDDGLRFEYVEKRPNSMPWRVQ